MAYTIIRAVGYTGSRQVLTWPSNASYNSAVTAYLWGGGGGGGGQDDTPGGNGCGAGFSRYSFTVDPGDQLEISIGSGGGAGVTSPGVGNAAGGSPGLSLVLGGAIFNTRSMGGVYAVSNGAYCTFLNNFGVWGDPSGSGASFDRTITVNFPSTGLYTFEGSVDNQGYIYLDGNLVLFMPGEYAFQRTWTTNINVSAGTHTLRIIGQNWHGPGSIGLTINGGSAFSGGRGGNAGHIPWSGGGGGGGGATVLRINGTLAAIAGGGAGGGGGGDNSGGYNAPGSSGQSSSWNNGQDGATHPSDGGGGGAGGGGYYGGNGGGLPGGDNGAFAGVYGSSWGNYTENPSGINPGGRSNGYWSGGSGIGGTQTRPGTPGYAVFVFSINGTFIKTGDTWQNVKQTYIKQDNTWKAVKGVFVKNGGTWEPVDGTNAPYFTSVGGAFGYSSRPY